jgi:hypothetical protein
MFSNSAAFSGTTNDRRVSESDAAPPQILSLEAARETLRYLWFGSAACRETGRTAQTKTTVWATKIKEEKP